MKFIKTKESQWLLNVLEDGFALKKVSNIPHVDPDEFVGEASRQDGERLHGSLLNLEVGSPIMLGCLSLSGVEWSFTSTEVVAITDVLTIYP